MNTAGRRYLAASEERDEQMEWGKIKQHKWIRYKEEGWREIKLKWGKRRRKMR